MTRPLRILILSNFVQYERNANVIRDFLFSWKQYSAHEYYYVYDCHDLTAETSFSAYDAIIVFWDVYIIGKSILPIVADHIAQAEALKILFLQDEYRDVTQYQAMAARLGINVICTCVAEADHERFYPQSSIPTLQACYTVLTGYVPAYLETAPPDLTTPRPIEIGYRARDLPYELGDLGQEKTIIATRFQQISAQYGLASDISTLESARIYGADWVTFLRSSRLTLGTGSGASVIDFTGEVGRQVRAYRTRYPKATYAEVKQRFFAELDGKLVIDTISPRFFETTGCGNTLVLHEGPYAGILIPDRHYICVKKDYSNLDEVLAKIADHAYCRQLAQQAYDDLIASKQWNYATFIRWFDGMLAQHVTAPRARTTTTPEAYVSQARTVLMNEQLMVRIATRNGDVYVRPVQAGIIPSLLPLYRKLTGLVPLTLRTRINKTLYAAMFGHNRQRTEAVLRVLVVAASGLSFVYRHTVGRMRSWLVRRQQQPK